MVKDLIDVLIFVTIFGGVLSSLTFALGVWLGRRLGREQGRREAWRVVVGSVGEKLKTPFGTVKVEAEHPVSFSREFGQAVYDTRKTQADIEVQEMREFIAELELEDVRTDLLAWRDELKRNGRLP